MQEEVAKIGVYYELYNVSKYMASIVESPYSTVDTIYIYIYINNGKIGSIMNYIPTKYSASKGIGGVTGGNSIFFL